MPEMTRQVSWGDALVVEQFRYPGGLKAAVAAIQREVGAHIGVRGTFQKLLRVTDPHALPERDRYRAWLLLTAFGQSPEDWGISDSVVPRSVDMATLREALTQARKSNPGTTSANAATTEQYWPGNPEEFLTLLLRTGPFGLKAAS